MNKKIIVFIIMICVVFSGCQLAVEDASAEAENDKLIGYFVTDESVELFGDGEYTLEEGVVTFRDSVHTDKVYGTINSVDPINVSFEGFEGAYIVEDGYDIDGVKCHRIGSSSHFCKVGTASFVTDNSEENQIYGTVYVKGSQEYINVIMNPIYKTPDGEIYFVPGDGIAMRGDDGGIMSKAVSESFTSTVNGEEIEESFEVKVSVETALDAEYYLIKEMDENDEVVSTLKVYIDNIPDSIEIDGSTEYIIVEKVGVNFDGETVSEREIVENFTLFIHTYFFGDSVFASRESIEIIEG